MKTKLLFVLALGVMLTSCKTLYKPTMQNVPMLKGKSDFRSTLSYNNYQFAYALSNNFGIMLNGHHNKNEWSSSFDSISRNDYFTRRYSIDAGVGYFKNFSENTVFECYAGGGYGGYQFDYDIYTKDVYERTNNYHTASWRSFVQPSIAYRDDIFEIAFSTRFMGVGFFDVVTRNYTQDELISENLNNLDQNFYTFIEPAITLRVGHRMAKFHVQCIYSQLLSTKSLSYIPLNINFGISFNVFEWFSENPPRYHEGTVRQNNF
ncbi:MAG: hypothetical protein PF448_02680 [Bacteroidales bacterium]|nr:hypothetical protein [Bacteroidales bacterium]